MTSRSSTRSAPSSTCSVERVRRGHLQLAEVPRRLTDLAESADERLAMPPRIAQHPADRRPRPFATKCSPVRDLDPSSGRSLPTGRTLDCRRGDEPRGVGYRLSRWRRAVTSDTSAW